MDCWDIRVLYEAFEKSIQIKFTAKDAKSAKEEKREFQIKDFKFEISNLIRVHWCRFVAQFLLSWRSWRFNFAFRLRAASWMFSHPMTAAVTATALRPVFIT